MAWIMVRSEEPVLPRYIAKGDISRLNVYIAKGDISRLIFSHIAKKTCTGVNKDIQK